MNKKTTIYSITGAILLLLFVAFAVFCPWSGLVWLVVWIITLVLLASTLGRNQQLQITINQVMDQTRRAIQSAEMSNAHNSILMNIIDEMEKGGADLSKATNNVIKKETEKAKTVVKEEPKTND